jgi:CBS domain-containing protein
MRVAELMQAPVRTIALDSTLADVVVELADGHISALPVVDGGEHMVGVVSTADVLVAQAEHAEQWERMSVDEVMTQPALTITPDAAVSEAAQRMLYGDVHRLFVEDNGTLVGVISQTDVVRALATRKLGK